MPAPPFIAAAAAYGGGSANVSLFVESGTVLQPNRCVLFLAVDEANTGINPVSAIYGGAPMTAGSVFTAPGGQKYRLFWQLNVATFGTDQGIVTWSGVTSHPDVYGFSYSDVLAVSGETSASAVANTAPSWTVPSTPSTSTVVSVMARPHVGGMSSTPAAPAVSRHSLLNATNWLDNDIWDEPGASSVTINGTIESNTWFGVAVSLDGAGGGGGGGVTLANIERSVGRGSFRGQY